MTPRPGDEAPRSDLGEGGSDAVTFAFADRDAGVYGVARVGLADGSASGLALLFAGAEPVAVRAEGGVAVEERSWEAVEAGGVQTEVVTPLEAWKVRFDDGGGRGFELELAAVSEAAELAPDAAAARTGGMSGYDHLCKVEGVARTGSRSVRVRGFGQRGRLWGAPDWGRLELTRTVGVWLGDDAGVALTAVRPAGARGQDEESITATLFDGGPPAAAVAVAEPRLTTVTDAEGRQRRAGLELWVREDGGFPHRAAGEVVCGTSLDLGRLRLQSAFLQWRMDGRTGTGRYDLLRRAA